MNDHWNVLYQVSVFYVNRKSKMATTAGHRLTRQECSLDGPLQSLGFLCDQKSKMATTAGNRLTLDPI